MGDILVFRTSTDATMKRLFQDLGKEKIDCLIQSSQINKYKTKYSYINFIDIFQESFYDVPDEVVHMMCQKVYDQVYVTFSGTTGHNYGNVMELLSKMNYKSAFFYNCNGDKFEIHRKHILKDMICRLYIKWIGFFYELRGR